LPSTEGSAKKRKKDKRKSQPAQDENASPVEMTNGKLSKSEDGNIENNVSTPTSQKSGKFKWAKVAEKLLLQTPEKELSVKKLKKKVFSEYVLQTSDQREEVTQELEEKFAEKITKNERFQIEGKQIRLVV